ncbi:MAG: AAA domain-containing protein [Nannocystaceae bacterium]
MVEPKRFKRRPDFLDKLSKLHEFLIARDGFAADRDLNEILGSLFSGINTDWPRLQAIIDHSQQLRNDWGGSKASDLLSDWPSHVERMQKTSMGVDRGCAMVTEFKGCHPLPDSLWQRPMSEIAGVFKKWEGRIAAAKSAIVQPWCDLSTSLTGGLSAAKSYMEAIDLKEKIEAWDGFEVLREQLWRHADTPLATLQGLAEWIQARLDLPGCDALFLVNFFDEAGEPQRRQLEELMSVVARVVESVRDHTDGISRIGELDPDVWLDARDAGLGGLRLKLERCVDQVDGVLMLGRWEVSRAHASSRGFDAIVNDLISGKINGHQCSAAYESGVYSTILRSRVDASSALREFGRDSYERLRERFAEADREILELTAREIAALAAREEVPKGVGSGRVSELTEAALLRHEAQKKSRHIPIRRLVRRAPNALQRLKPCFLMSPLSVAQFLPPGEIEFDLVVMDEASQICPEDALGALARARTAIVVGDPKQLPPTSFLRQRQSRGRGARRDGP